MSPAPFHDGIIQFPSSNVVASIIFCGGFLSIFMITNVFLLQEKSEYKDRTECDDSCDNDNTGEEEATVMSRASPPQNREFKLVDGEASKGRLRTETASTIRKQDFMNSDHGTLYGYPSSPKGHIDTWREREFPSMIKPISLHKSKCDKIDKNIPVVPVSPVNDVDEREVYLDHAGAGIPSRSLLDAIHAQDLKNQIAANPHSMGPAASRTKAGIESVKKQILDFFDANAGCKYGYTYQYEEEGDEEDYHPGYDIIFTSGTTQALQIIADNFHWSQCQETREKSTLLYSHNSHTSVIGMREPVLKTGATFQCRQLNEISTATSEDFDNWVHDEKTYTFVEHLQDSETSLLPTREGSPHPSPSPDPNHLLVIPLECNFGGTRSNARKIFQVARASHSNWFTVLDIAKAAATSKIDLRKLDPDFACVSFYKMFGAPTGVGALFVKRSSVHTMTRYCENERKYFGGGAVDIVLPKQDFVRRRSSSSILDGFISGTVNFRSILALQSGLDEISRIGMEAISGHTQSLVIETISRLLKLQHSNGRPVVEIYGNCGVIMEHMKNKSFVFDPSSDELKGSIVSLNVLRSDGTCVGYNEVSKLAALNAIPMQFRTGCFCNPGGCQDALKIDEDRVKRNYLTNKKVCGDHIDIIDGFPTGAVRISVGKDSIWEDIDTFICFIEQTFRDNGIFMRHAVHEQIAPDNRTIPRSLKLEEVYVFPIKSCAAMPVKRWEMDVNTGKLKFDREFALVDSSGTALRLCQYPKMGSIKPHVDLQKMIIEVSAPGCPNLTINLRADGASSIKEIKVCGNKCDGQLWGSHAVSSWFTEYLGVQCWLARSQDAKNANNSTICERKNLGFENEAPLLLVSKNSINKLNLILKNRSLRQVNAKHFRPNLVVALENSEDNNNPEDHWKSIHFSNSGLELSVTGQCARCSMVDVDPSSGMKGSTLRALAEYRRSKGQITFGIFLGISSKSSIRKQSKSETLWVERGETLSLG